MAEAKLAAIGRRLAEALADAAYTRKDEDKKRVAQLQMELCAAVKQESTEEKTDE